MTATIGLDYTAAYEQGAGIGRQVRQLIGALSHLDHENDYRLLVMGARAGQLPAPLGPNFAWHPARLRTRWLWHLWYTAHAPIPIETWLGRLDLFHAQDFVLPPCRSRTRTVLTIHDLSYVRTPETFPPALLKFLNQTVPPSVARADHILATSQATQDDLAQFYGVPADKMTVIYSGIEPRFQPVTDKGLQQAVRRRYRLPDGPFTLAVGTLQPRKNYPRLIQALYQANLPDLHLVIAGGKGWLEAPIHAQVAELGLQNRVHLIGFVADEDLSALYSLATLTAYPSLYEGFGFPILESMACGTPVLASTTSSMPEVSGQAAWLVDPLDTEALAEGLRRLLTDPALRETLSTAGLERARQFTWERAAQQLYDLYQRLLAS
ncbi:MAG: glycosyltransferase family 4 protein [Anaerolineae bacterium]|nr:glycosyltransferase family 4 protein [Anaerolineae bacterium]